MTTVVCELCPHRCAIPDGGAGDCRIRVNLGGKLIATTYGRPSAVHVDPMEKKPLFHFLPGTPIFSIATAGCNLHCKNCQNWQLSQRGGEEMEETYRAEPDQVVAAARENRCRSVAYTYSDPVVWYEYTRDTAVAAHAAGLRNVLVTAGFLNKEPMRQLARVLDATNTDIKALDDGFYQSVCGARLKPVLDGLVVCREEGMWIEITNLVIPTLNDDPKWFRKLAKWILDELGPGTPLHFSRFTPRYKMRNLPQTPTSTVERARAEALDVGLQYVYVGNLFGNEGESTRCPHDNTMLIERAGYQIRGDSLHDGRCPTCGLEIPGVWK